MATLAVDKPRVYEPGQPSWLNGLPMIDNDIIYKGAAVGESGTTGTFRPLVSGDNFAGFAAAQCDNTITGHAASFVSVPVHQQGQVQLPITGVTSAAQYGDPIFATDDDTFTLTPGGSLIGTFVRWISSTTALVHFKAAVLRSEKMAESQVKTANYTVLVNDSGKTFSTKGAAGTVVFALPVARVGLKYRFYVGAAQELRIDPDGTEQISLPSTGVPSAAGAYITANAIGETVEIECTEAGVWAVFGFTGTWTAV
jgi:hypothetical protein